ncbi:hypothetical protein MKY48_13610 [Paenibacillus sp. FSL W8-0187]|uniref:hypothetical protein n=1 Tax=Paenibacillus sp. FSL W8-0187 TaxID=2921710 RepID=UPI0030D74638
MDVLERAQQRKTNGESILADLDLLNLWRSVGTPIIVGGLAYNLVVNPDIDIEIYCDEPDIKSGMAILASLAINPNVTHAKYSNHLDGPDQGLYFQIKYKDYEGEVWKIDMWLMAHDHPGPCAMDLVKPLVAVLDESKRRMILNLKEKAKEGNLKVASIKIYEAVIDYNIENLDEFLTWYESQSQGLTFWKPRDV